MILPLMMRTVIHLHLPGLFFKIFFRSLQGCTELPGPNGRPCFHAALAAPSFRER